MFDERYRQPMGEDKPEHLIRLYSRNRGDLSRFVFTHDQNKLNPRNHTYEESFFALRARNDTGCSRDLDQI